jgi:hypothetical protein
MWLIIRAYRMDIRYYPLDNLSIRQAIRPIIRKPVTAEIGAAYKCVTAQICMRNHLSLHRLAGL